MLNIEQLQRQSIQPQPPHQSPHTPHNSPNIGLKLFLFSILALLLGFAYLANFKSNLKLFYPKSTQKPETVVIQAQTPSPQHPHPIPLWVIAAIPICFANGCWIIFRLLNPSLQGEKLLTKIKNRGNSTKGTLPHPPQWQPAKFKTTPVFSLDKPLPPMIAQNPVKPLLTIVPPEHRYSVHHPLNKILHNLNKRKY